MLAAHESGDIDAVLPGSVARQQRQRPTLGIAGNHDVRAASFALAGLTLPGGEEIETLIGRVRDVAAFQLAPGRLGLAEIGDDVHGRNTARLRPVARLRRPAID